MHQWKVTTLQDLAKTAKEITPLLKHKLVCIDGEMGAGKTTFVSYLLKHWQAYDEVSSPTYALVNEYQTPNMGIVYHFDFYRINDLEEVWDMGWEEYLYSNNWCIVEWPNKIAPLLPTEKHQLNIENHLGTRTITLH